MIQGDLDLRPIVRVSSRATARRPSWARYSVIVSLGLFLFLHPMSGQQAPKHGRPSRILQRLLAPLRSNPFSQSTVGPCELGLATCFSSATAAPSDPESGLNIAQGPSRQITLQLRIAHRWPLAHRWLELDGPDEEMTFGFGPATLPFIDSGQVSVRDRFGNVERISGMHPLPWLALPPINYHYARSPGEGHAIGKPIQLTMAQSDALVRKLQHTRFVGPYIPILHDCRTYTCVMLASAQGRSTLPCYLLVKGYW